MSPCTRCPNSACRPGTRKEKRSRLCIPALLCRCMPPAPPRTRAVASQSLKRSKLLQCSLQWQWLRCHVNTPQVKIYIAADVNAWYYAIIHAKPSQQAHACLIEVCEAPSFINLLHSFAPHMRQKPSAQHTRALPLVSVFDSCKSHLATALSTASFGGIIPTWGAGLHILAFVRNGIAHLAASHARDAKLADRLQMAE